MSLYSLALFVHVIGVLGTFMAIAIELREMIGLQRAKTVEQVRNLTSALDFVDNLFVAGGVCILVPGFYMTTTVWGWATPWIDVALALLLIMCVLGPLINMRRLKAIQNMARALPQGPVSGELAARINDPVLWTSVLTMTALAVGIVFLMTVKPGLVVTSGTAVVALLVGLILSPFSRRWVGSPAING